MLKNFETGCTGLSKNYQFFFYIIWMKKIKIRNCAWFFYNWLYKLYTGQKGSA